MDGARTTRAIALEAHKMAVINNSDLPFHFRGSKHKNIMFSFKFCMVAEIFIQIGPWAGAKLQAKHARLCANCKKMADFCTIWRFFKDDGVHETSEAALGAFLKGGGVLETSEAAPDTCLNLAVSLRGT